MAEEKKNGFSQWFQENSGYSLHRVQRRHFSKTDCCGKQPQPTGRQILFQNPQTGEEQPFQLCRCSYCGAYYVGWQGRWCKIENLLRCVFVKQK